MKPKWLIAVLLAAVVVVALWRANQPDADSKHAVVSDTGAPKAGVVARPLPAKQVKMTTVAMTPTNMQARIPNSSNWSAVQVIVDERAKIQDRFRAVDALATRIGDSDWEALRSFLLKPVPTDGSVGGQILKNVLMDALSSQNPPLPDLGDVLARVFRDRNQNDVVRDYAVQHLATYYEYLPLESNYATTRQTLQSTLWEASNEPVGSIPGTALLALNRLSRRYTDSIDQTKVAAAALRLARSPVGGELSKISAYQICAELGVADALSTVVQAAQTGENLPTRLSATAALGKLGGGEQVSLLESILTSSQEQLKPAARQALAQISARQSGAPNQK